MIHYFNPGHEVAINNGSKYYNAPANSVLMQQQLSFLPAWYANPSDFIFVSDNFDRSFHNVLKQYIPSIPNIVDSTNLDNCPDQELVLWGISPQSIHYFHELNIHHNAQIKLPEWKDEFVYANGRENSKECLSELIKNIPNISSEIKPIKFTELDAIIRLVEETPYALLAKAPYSSSGKGLLWLDRGEVGQSQRQILKGMLKKQAYVTIEKVLNKTVDFVMEFYSDAESVNFVGYSIFTTDSKGAYKGSYLGSQESILKMLTQYISQDLLDIVKKNLLEIFAEKYSGMYKGYLGVDMFIYKDSEAYKLQPCVEINMRSNMGLLAIKISEKYISENTKGHFFISFNPKKGEIFAEHTSISKKYPSKFEGGKLKTGYLPLCPVDGESNYWAYILTETI